MKCVFKHQDLKMFSVKFKKVERIVTLLDLWVALKGHFLGVNLNQITLHFKG